MSLLADVPASLTSHAVEIVGIVVVAVGLAVFGRTDVARFSWTRIWAISGVCFAESIRRKVLWIIPLAIVGLVAVVQLQQPADEQDAIRQTTKFCLLASGLVVVLTTLILACTNLPREIENRVIFTVVTKPTTRLEIVLGKVVGFARVSFTILLVMGLFTWGYLHLRAYALTSDLRHRLAEPGAIEPISRPTSQHYVDAGLLNAKSLADPLDMNVFGRPPVAGTRRRYLNGEGNLLAPFVLPDNLVAYVDPEGKQFPGAGLRITIKLGYDRVTGAPTTGPAAAAAAAPPQVFVQVFDANVNTLLTHAQVANGPRALPSPDGSQALVVDVPMSVTSQLRNNRLVFVAVSTAAGAHPLWVDDDPKDRAVQLDMPVVTEAGPKRLHLNPGDPTDDNKPGDLLFTGREGTYGQQVKGDPTGAAQTCVYRFRGVNVAAARVGDAVPIEMRVGIEKNGDTATDDVLTDVQLAVTDPATGRSTPIPGSIHPENNRTLYGSIPAALCGTGDFDVSVQCRTPDQWVGLKPTSLTVVEHDSSFGLNLTKSLAVLWLLSILVTTISVFCSTFLSWPTAVVLTIVVLFGRWGLNELGDAASAGLGRQFVGDFGVTNPAVAGTLAGSVDVLNRTFKAVASVLPDVASFSATDDIDRGLAIPLRTLWTATQTLLGFGLPLTVLAFVRLKYKEVAP